jgi:hypothetical protein
MTKMISLKKTAADRDAEKKAMGEGGPGTRANPEDDGGVTLHLEHHHLQKMGVGGGLKSGHKVELSAAGHVEHSETRSTPQGERNSARLRLTKMGVEHETDHGEERKDLRNEIEQVHGASEKKSDGFATWRGGKKIAEAK